MSQVKVECEGKVGLSRCNGGGGGSARDFINPDLSSGSRGWRLCISNLVAPQVPPCFRHQANAIARWYFCGAHIGGCSVTSYDSVVCLNITFNVNWKKKKKPL